MTRFVVLDGVDPAAAERFALRRGLPLRTVADRNAAADAVLAAISGAEFIVRASGPREVTDQLCEDLGRIGDLDHRVGDAEPAGGSTEADADLSADELALLGQLLAGKTLGEAARALHLSRRTADRRLAAARRALGAANTSEALVIARRHGITSVE